MNWVWKLRAVCGHCGYNLAGLRRTRGGTACPECGEFIRMSAAQVRNALYARTVNRISAALAIAPFALACLGAGVISTRVEFLCTLFYGAAFCCSIAYLIWATSAPFIVFARARRTTRRDPHGLARRAAMITLAASAVTLVLFLVLLMAAVGVTAFNAD